MTKVMLEKKKTVKWQGIAKLAIAKNTTPSKAKKALAKMGLWSEEDRAPSALAIEKACAEIRESTDEARSKMYGCSSFTVWSEERLGEEFDKELIAQGGQRSSIAVGGRTGAERRLAKALQRLTVLDEKEAGLGGRELTDRFRHPHMSLFWIFYFTRNTAAEYLAKQILQAEEIAKTFSAEGRIEAQKSLEEMKDLLRWAKRIVDWREGGGGKMTSQTRELAAKALKANCGPAGC